MQKIVPNLWFDSQAEEAARFYVSVFKKKSKISTVSKYPKSAEAVSGKPAGSVMTVSFTLNGQPFMALNGGPTFKFNESVSLMVYCKNQHEIDYYWEKLSAVPESEQCGWLKDKFGLSWQIVWQDMEKMMKNATPAQMERLMAALLPMKKLDLKKLKEAYNSR